MKVKKEYGVLAAIIVVLVLYLVFREQEKTHYRLPKLPRVAGTEISKIDISKLDTSIVVTKKDDSWYLTPKAYPANKDKIRDILAIIENLSLTAMVSESKNYNRYDLGNDKKLTVRAWAGEKLRREFEVGKAAPSHRHTFVKLAGDDRVYHAQGNFRSKFDQTAENFRDRTVLSFGLTQIQEVTIAKGQQSIRFVREQLPVDVNMAQKSDTEKTPPPKSETIWQSAGGKKGDQSKLSRLLTVLSNFRCAKYIEDRKKDDFTDPIYTIRLKGTEEYTLSIFAKKDENAKNYPAISSQSDFPFLLSDGQAGKIMQDPD
jgi:hypothetical protein